MGFLVWDRKSLIVLDMIRSAIHRVWNYKKVVSAYIYINIGWIESERSAKLATSSLRMFRAFPRTRASLEITQPYSGIVPFASRWRRI
jgi:hypothetical protein